MRRPTTYLKARAYRRPGGRLGRYAPARFGGKRRSMFVKTPTFTETLDFGNFTMPASGPYLGQLQCSLNSIPQWSNYATLYNQARITRVQYILMPEFNQYGPQADAHAATLSITTPRLVYSIQDTAGVAGPVSELDVLTDNGCKIRQFNRPLKIAHRPVADLGQLATTLASALVFTTKKNQWIKTDALGASVSHGAINYAVTQDVQNTSNPQTGWVIYAKITFQLRDPK